VRIIAAGIVLIIGLGLLGLGIYGYFYGSNRILCEEGLAEIERLTRRGLPAQGDPDRPAFSRELEIADRKVTVFCPNAKDDRRKATIAGVSGIVLAAVSALMLRSFWGSRKRRNAV
jgi:hypothetical protein